MLPNSVGTSPIEPFLQEVAKPFAQRDGTRTSQSPLICAGQRGTDRETETQMVWATEDLTSKPLQADFWEPGSFQDVSLLPLPGVLFCFEMRGFHSYERSLIQF